MNAQNLEKYQNKWIDDEDEDEELAPRAFGFTKSLSPKAFMAL